MRRLTGTVRFHTYSLAGLFFCGLAGEVNASSIVSGVVCMPDVCSPAISPAVVYLTPADSDHDSLVRSAASHASSAGPAEVVLVNQRELQF
jgi:high-affinity iron transporter